MNSYLLDTHILLWWLANDKELNKTVKDIIADSDNNIIVSSVTIWEIIIKKSLNKLDAPNNLKEAIEINNFKNLSLTIDHALYLEKLPSIHNDPFDRLLIAQCLVNQLTIITSDKIIPKYKIKFIKN